MPYELPIIGGSASFPANTDLSTKQYYAMKVNSSGNVVICDTAGEQAFGILDNKPAASGRSAGIVRHGITKAILAGTVAVMDKLTVDANGKLVVGYGADKVAAIALEAGVSGDIIAVEVVAVAGAFAQHGPHSKTFHLKHAKLADGDIITQFTPGYPFRIKKTYAVVTDPVTTGAKLSTLNLEIGSTNLTGGTIALTSANQTPLGAVVANAANPSAGNTGSATDTISVEASATTTFAEGEFDLVIEFA